MSEPVLPYMVHGSTFVTINSGDLGKEFNEYHSRHSKQLINGMHNSLEFRDGEIAVISL